MAVMVLPMTAQTKAQEEAAAAGFRRATTVKPVASTTLERRQFKGTIPTLRADIPEGYCAITLAADDVWQDGTGYQMLLDADANTYGTVIPETGGLTTYGDADPSVYAEFEYKIPENADGSLYTTNVLIDDAMTIYIPAGTYDWCITNPTPGDRLWIASSNGSVPGRYDDFEFEAGATYIFYVSLGGQNDQVDLEIIDPMAPVMPENVTADPAVNTADVAWENDHDPAFNLRYRVYNPNVSQTLEWNFDDYNFDGWLTYDVDGDGYGWYYVDDSYYANSGSVCLASASWISGVGGLEPDNWLISPEVPLNGTLTIHAASASSSYVDDFAVYVAVGEDPAIEEYVAISDITTAPYYYYGYGEYTFDLSQFEGQNGHFAIRHFNVYDEMRLYVDDITLEIPGDEPNEWIVVENIEGNDYTIEGLDPETTYEVQVQAVAEDGRTSNWTESVLFTTLESGETPPEPTVKTGAPTFHGYTEDGIHAYFVEILETEPSTIYYMVYIWNTEINDWALVGEDEWIEYEDILSFVDEGKYRVVAYAVADGKLPSEEIAYEFVVSPIVGIDEMMSGKTVAGVRYFNMAGQEMQEANGMTIVVTTYTDGTTSAVKVVK